MAPGMVLFVSATPLLTEREQSLFICTARVAYSSTRETCHPRSLNSAQKNVVCTLRGPPAQRAALGMPYPRCRYLGKSRPSWRRARLPSTSHRAIVAVHAFLLGERGDRCLLVCLWVAHTHIYVGHDRGAPPRAPPLRPPPKHTHTRESSGMSEHGNDGGGEVITMGACRPVPVAVACQQCQRDGPFAIANSSPATARGNCWISARTTTASALLDRIIGTAAVTLRQMSS